MSRFDVCALGELLIDFTENGTSPQGNPIMEANPGADMMLSEADVNEQLISDSRIFHFGSLSMTGEICEAATRKALAIAKENGLIISFDPNLRENLWDNIDRAREMIAYGMSQCNILKISDNEIQWFTGEQDFDRAVEKLRHRYGNIRLLLLSLGKDGSRAYSGENSAYAPAAPAKTIETTGAGDTFCGAVLSKVLEYGLREYSEQELSDMLSFANAAAAVVTERKGALRVMPQQAEITDRMRRSRND